MESLICYCYSHLVEIFGDLNVTLINILGAHLSSVHGMDKLFQSCLQYFHIIIRVVVLLWAEN